MNIRRFRALHDTGATYAEIALPGQARRAVMATTLTRFLPRSWIRSTR